MKYSEYSLHRVQYVYEAQLVFVEVSSGVYSIGKNKLNRPGGYFTAQDVVNAMNSEDVKVAVCQDTLENVKTANFKIKPKGEVRID